MWISLIFIFILENDCVSAKEIISDIASLHRELLGNDSVEIDV